MMRLVNTMPVKDPKTRLMRVFPQDETPPYAILSHRWSPRNVGEVTFQHLDPNSESPKGPVSYKKITEFCNKAFDAGFEWAWIDTCCINHEDSQEEGKSINSMCSWYRKAEVCYAYLADVTKLGDIGKSDWFKRGWTLQELLAPRNLIFFDRNWIDIGSRALRRDIIQETTKIPPEILLINTNTDYSVAQIISWATGRETSRPEDRAYSLLGLLRITMALDYTEGGEKAFVRLQQEIIKRSTDHSIFSWTAKLEEPGKLRDAFAKSPDEFASCADVEPNTTSREFALTNNGLRIQMRINDKNTNMIWGVLDCTRKGKHVAIPLEQIGDAAERRYGRLGHRGPADGATDVEAAIFNEMEYREVYIAPTGPRNFNLSEWMDAGAQYTFFMEPPMTPGSPLVIDLKATGEGRWKFGPRAWELKLEKTGHCGAMLLQHPLGEDQFVVMLGVHNNRVWTNIEPKNGSGESLQEITNNYLVTANDFHTSDRGKPVLNGLDEHVQDLGGGKRVSVKIRNGEVRREKCFRVRISFLVYNSKL
ncbi:unnamed protein product [Colletotrichum noveboracense]|uniref:Heterokaryon incompatibility domain-containing protein n=1 Tax=Colletotrichum noveboracense TaxID=2664923 RepID=A0A9W4RTB0_9PEZI|nr:unnamed protein product [Colletotrichum noveboracense]